MEPTTNIWITAFEAIKRTPVGEAGQYLATPFFRDDRRHITIIRDGRQERFDYDYGAAELVRLNLQTGDTR